MNDKTIQTDEGLGDQGLEDVHADEEQVSDKILTIPNLISLIRLCLVAPFLVLLLDGHDIWATVVYALAAGTDWIDGQVARRTNSVSRLGQLMDPAVDRVLILAGVVGLLLVGRLPLWIVVFVIARDGLMLLGGGYLLSKYKIRIPVIYLGKVTTAFLMFGFAGLLLNWPQIPGLGVADSSIFPGFGPDPVSWGIWFVYIGLVLSLFTCIYYIYTAYKQLKAATAASDEQSA